MLSGFCQHFSAMSKSVRAPVYVPVRAGHASNDKRSPDVDTSRHRIFYGPESNIKAKVANVFTADGNFHPGSGFGTDHGPAHIMDPDIARRVFGMVDSNKANTSRMPTSESGSKKRSQEDARFSAGYSGEKEDNFREATQKPLHERQFDFLRRSMNGDIQHPSAGMDTDDELKVHPLPKRFRDVPIRVRDIDEDPCLEDWAQLVECFTASGWENSPCAQELMAFNMCAQQAKATLIGSKTKNAKYHVRKLYQKQRALRNSRTLVKAF